MKTTTKIIIGLAIFTFIILESSMVYTSLYLHTPIYTMAQEKNVAIISTVLEEFTSLKFKEENMVISNSDNVAFRIIQNDSISDSYISYPENIIDYLRIENINGSFIFSLIDKDQTDEAYRYSISIIDPITIFTSSMPDSISNEISNILEISGQSRRNMFIKTSGPLKFENMQADSLYLTGKIKPYRDKNMCFIFNNTNIETIEVNNFYGPIKIISDSLSSVRNFTVYGPDDYRQNLTLNSLRIDQFSFIPGKSNSDFILTGNEAFTTSFKTRLP